jgi:death-on-curing protein
VNDVEFRFLTLDQIDDIHSLAIEMDGGERGLHDFGNLEKSTEAPRTLASVQTVDAFEVAAAYAHSFTLNRAYEDGNKRTALTAALVFLGQNGFSEHHFDQANLEQAIRFLAKREMSPSSFAQFLRDAHSGATGVWADEG